MDQKIESETRRDVWIMEKILLGQVEKINDKLSDISRDLGHNTAQHEAMESRLDEIHEQAVKTNGRVNSLERFKVKIIAYSTVISFILVSALKLMN